MTIKYRLTRKLWLLTVLMICPACGGAKFEKLELSYSITNDLKVSPATVRVIGIHANTPDVQKAKAFMDNFYKEDYFEIVRDLQRTPSTSAYSATLINTGETSCDAVLFSKRLDLLEAISPFSQMAFYTISLENERLLVTFAPTESTRQFIVQVPVEVTISFQGRILEQNAHKYDQATGAMLWRLRDLGSEGLRFVLAIPKKS